jgi:manganese oxidase
MNACRKPALSWTNTVAIIAAVLVFVSTEADAELRPNVASTAGRHRIFYLGVDVVNWNYSPAGENVCQGRPFNDEELGALSGAFHSYRKAIFRQYTNRSFSHRVAREQEWHHLGLLGPALHAESGDTITVVLRNRAEFDVDFVVDNVAWIGGLESRRVVRPGKVGEYKFLATKESAPAAHSYTSSAMHFYRSAVGGPGHVYAGMLGPLIVTRAGEADSCGRPLGVENEIVTVLWVGDEGLSPYWELENKAHVFGNLTNGESENDSVEDPPKFLAINGLVYCSLASLNMRIGKRTRWYGGGVGNEADIHTLHAHGNVAVTSSGQHGDSFNILPYTSIALDYVPENVGTYLVHCHISKHFQYVCVRIVLNAFVFYAALNQSML